jgi:hypothetical protein
MVINFLCHIILVWEGYMKLHWLELYSESLFVQFRKLLSPLNVNFKVRNQFWICHWLEWFFRKLFNFWDLPSIFLYFIALWNALYSIKCLITVILCYWPLLSPPSSSSLVLCSSQEKYIPPINSHCKPLHSVPNIWQCVLLGLSKY